ncbi:MAG TPA: universal stress protein [Pirellulales bacterium]|nr:universal stress protein [Pirellulales bacterium]
MSELKKILVGVDLLQSRRGNLSAPVMEATKQALGLAERVSGEVMFLAAIELPDDGDLYSPLLNRRRIAGEIETSAREALKKLVEQATARGVRATSKFAHGRGWIELTREAVTGQHDLVIVGSRHSGTMHRMLFGSTAIKLLHNCPSPVWVAKPEPHPSPANLLVASDFSEASTEALRLALLLASGTGAKVHLIHVLERPYIDLWEAGLFEAPHEELSHAEDGGVAESRLKEQLSQVGQAVGPSVEISVVEYPSVADFGILQYIGDHQIDLLLLGTTARRGIAGFFLGNTAERLLTTLPCSLVAVKPAGFVCPVRLEPHPSAATSLVLGLD